MSLSSQMEDFDTVLLMEPAAVVSVVLVCKLWSEELLGLRDLLHGYGEKSLLGVESVYMVIILY